MEGVLPVINLVLAGLLWFSLWHWRRLIDVCKEQQELLEKSMAIIEQQNAVIEQLERGDPVWKVIRPVRKE